MILFTHEKEIAPMRPLFALALLPFLCMTAHAETFRCPKTGRIFKVVGPGAVQVVDHAAHKIVHEKVLDPVAVFVPSYVATLAPYAVAAPAYPAAPPVAPAPLAPAAPAYPAPPAVGYGAPVAAVAPVAHAPSACHSDIALALKPIMQRLHQIENGHRPPAGKPLPGVPKTQPPADDGEPVPEVEKPQPDPKPAANPAVNPQASLPRAFGKCASCHSDAAAKGGGFAMFTAGKLESFSEKQVRLIAAKTYSGTMPPKSSGVTLTDEEVGEVMAWVSSQK